MSHGFTFALVRILGEREEIRIDHAAWSEATFGPTGTIGPVGPLKHLSKEALEAAEKPSDVMEFADCQLLLWDAQRRAGHSDEMLNSALRAAMAKNKAREWPAPKDGEAREHIVPVEWMLKMEFDGVPSDKMLEGNFRWATETSKYPGVVGDSWRPAEPTGAERMDRAPHVIWKLRRFICFHDDPESYGAVWTSATPLPEPVSSSAPDMEVEGLRRMLRECAQQFRFYEENHRAKGTPDAAVKAETNRQMAEKIEALVS